MKISIVGIIAGFCLIIVSFFVSVPDRVITDPKKYIGGDAYNYQIEATIRAGEIAGAKTAKAIYLVGGFILLFGSSIAFGILTEPKKNENNSDIIKKNLNNDVTYKEYNTENYDKHIKEGTKL